MASYSIERVKDTGIRFKLEEGSARELYDEITGKFGDFYREKNFQVYVPVSPEFGAFQKGESKLEAILLCKSIGDGSKNCGKVSLSYFKQKHTSPMADVDYPASDLFGSNTKTSYQSLTLFFNTTPPNISEKDLPWANEAQRDLFIEYLRN